MAWISKKLAIFLILISIGIVIITAGMNNDSKSDKTTENAEKITIPDDTILVPVDDRMIFYISQSLDTPEKVQSACDTWKLNAEKDLDAGKSTFIADTYFQICEIKSTNWTNQDEQEYLDSGGESLTIDIDAINSIIESNKGSKPSRSEYCQALKDWIDEYQNSEWLTEKAQEEHDKMCS
jgi:hypothetical protein